MKLALAIVTAALTLVALARPAAARVERFAVVIGEDRGAAGEVELRYARRDATRMADVLTNVGGFPAENVATLLEVDAAAARRALVSVNDRVRAALSDGAQVVLLVYYSGHADADALHLGATMLSLDELTKLVRGSSATLRLLVIDACRSGAALRRKGAHAAPEFDIDVDERLAGEGLVLMTASAANEDAQESDELGGSFFTHYLVSGLLGAADANGDGQVDVAEAYRFAYDETLRATSRTLAGTQHPSFRYDLVGLDVLVLTAPGAKNLGRVGVRFPGGRTYLVFRDSTAGPVVAEVGEHNTHRRLSLEPGRYFVRGRGSSDLVEGTVIVAAGPDVEVDPARLQRSAYVRLVRKGGARAKQAIWGVTAGSALRTDIYGGHALCPGVDLGGRVDLAHVALAARVGGCQSRFDAAPLSARNRELRLELRALHAWDLGPLALELGVVGGVAVLRQDFTTDGLAPPRTALAFDLGVTVGMEWPADAPLALAVDVTAGTSLYRRRDRPSDPSGLATEFVLRAQVGAIWRF